MTHRPNEDHKGTTLSNYIWKLKDQDIQYSLDWAVVTQSADYNPATGICRVCLEEKFFINVLSKGATLKDLNSSLTLDISLNFYLPPLVPKKQPKTEKEKPLGDEKALTD